MHHPIVQRWYSCLQGPAHDTTDLQLQQPKMRVPRQPAFLPPVLPRRSTRLIRKPSLRRPSPSTLSTATDTPVWRTLSVPDRCLRLSLTLQNGQAFRWHRHTTATHPALASAPLHEFSGPIGPYLYVLRQQAVEPPPGEDDTVWFRVLCGDEAESEAVLRDYLRVGHDLTELMQRFCNADIRFNHVFPYLRGVRVARQDPTECLFAFICSANNNLPRIAAMVRFLAMRYGTPLAEHAGVQHFHFPSAERLAAELSEDELRKNGFGYRAKYIVQTARMLAARAEKGDVSVATLLDGWRALDRADVAKELVAFAGIGRKVAGCIALFSLDQLGEIPCDTHIWQIAAREMPELRTKSLTDRVYDQIGEYFRGKFGEEFAGLVQTILFTAELPEFGRLVPGNENLVRVPRRRGAAEPRKRRKVKGVKKEEVELLTDE